MRAPVYLSRGAVGVKSGRACGPPVKECRRSGTANRRFEKHESLPCLEGRKAGGAK
jgi:hypothetical protein